MNSQGSQSTGGRWYFVVPIISAGLLAWVPFTHAASSLKEQRLWRLAAAYGIGALILFGVSFGVQTDANGEPEGGLAGLLSTVAGLLGLAMIVGSCLQLRGPRRRVHPPHNPYNRPPVLDPAVGNALAARHRRDEVRKLVVNDPMLARDLKVGRPDLQRDYYDGGLVDLNNVPGSVLVSWCGLSPEAAERVVSQRELMSEGFSSVEEAIVFSEQSATHASILRDRGVLLPR